MRVLFASAEALPYFRTGGLGDVARALPDALVRRGVDVRIVLPGFPATLQAARTGAEREPELVVPWPGGPLVAGCVRHRPGEGQAPAVLLEQPAFFRTAHPYAEQPDAQALARRFAFFSRAVLAYAKRWHADVIHCNEWHTGLVPLYAHLDGWDGGTLFAIHNLAYQGNFPPDVLRSTGVPDDFYRTENGVEFYGNASFMKSGIALAERLVTVSPTYALEIRTPTGGAGFDGLLRFRRRALHGILNGIDTRRWDPGDDAALFARYDVATLARKDVGRTALLAELGLSEGGPLIVMVTRLAVQKGIDLLLAVMRDLLATGARLALLGDGGEDYVAALEQWSARAPGRIACRFGFDDALAHRLFAGGDFLLMPSLYEPCGLGQMIAHRHGTVPIARRTGGLADTISDPRTGILFDEPEPAALAEALRRAAALWRGRGWNALRRRCMRLDHGWGRSAGNYLALYRLLDGRLRGTPRRAAEPRRRPGSAARRSS